MSDWRYLATRLNGNGTETLIHTELPLGGVSITDTLSGPQALSGSITPEDIHLVGSDGEPVFEPWSTAIYAEKDGLIRAGGIVEEMLVRSGTQLDIHCIGFAGYPKDQPWLAADYNGVEVDPLDVFRLIWSHLQSQERGNLGVVVDPLKSPIRIGKKATAVNFTTTGGEDVSFDAGPVMLHDYKTHDLLQEINKLIAVTPFDYREVHSWNGSGDTIKHRIMLGYPTLGTRRDDLRFVAGENIAITPDVLFPGDTYASLIFALGTGEGRKMIRQAVARPSETRIRRVAVISDKTADSAKKARDVAAKELKARLGRPEIDEIKVFDHPHARLGSFGVGDEIFIQTPEGWQGDLGLWARITSLEIKPDDPTVATISVVRVDRI